MAINFPDSPSLNDTHTVGDKTWTWDGTAWNVVVGGIPTSISELTITNDLTVDTDTLHVDSTNNRVGIGTTSPASALEIADGAAGQIRFEPTPLAIGSNNDGYELNLVGGTPDSYTNAGGRIRLGGGTRGDADIDSVIFMRDSTESMRIDSSGNVGIGTTSPDRGLHVDSSTAAVSAKFSSQHASLGLVELADSSSTATAQIGTNGDDIVFRPLQTERMRIDSNGFVGIGMTPTLPLDVEGRGRFVSPNVGSTGAVIVRQPAGDVDGGYIQWVNNANSAQMGTIYVSNSGSFAISPSSGTINLAGSNLQKNGTTFYGVGYADISFTVSSTTTAAWYMLSMPSGVDIYNMIGFTPLEGVNNTLTVYYWRLGVWSGIQTASQLYLHCALGNSVHTNPYYIRFYYRI